jgi:hypothetical protein
VVGTGFVFNAHDRVHGAGRGALACVGRVVHFAQEKDLRTIVSALATAFRKRRDVRNLRLSPSLPSVRCTRVVACCHGSPRRNVVRVLDRR